MDKLTTLHKLVDKFSRRNELGDESHSLSIMVDIFENLIKWVDEFNNLNNNFHTFANKFETLNNLVDEFHKMSLRK